MLKNYFNIAVRNLKKNKVFSLVNIIGLAIGLSAFWIISLYVANELSYDRYNGGSFKLAPTGVPFAPALKNDYPAIEDAVRIDPEGGGTVKYGEKQIKADDIFFADNAVFDVFNYHFLYGNSKEALLKPQSIVLTKSMAVKLFGSAEAAINKTVSFDNNFTNIVTGVIEDIPVNSHLTFSALRSCPLIIEMAGKVFMYILTCCLKKGQIIKN